MNHLVLFTAIHKSERRFDEMRKGEIDEFTVDLVDLDGDGELRENVKVGHVGITNKLTVGAKNVLGRIGSVDTGKGNPAWILNSFTDADVPKAQAWVEAQSRKSFAQPAAATAPVTPAAAAPAPATPALDQNAIAAALAGMTAEQIIAQMTSTDKPPF